MTGTAAPEAARAPGRTYFVPGFRVSQLQDRLGAGRDDGTPLPADLTGDVMRVQVDREASGIATYKLTLSNWFLGTPTDRAQLASRPPASAAYARERAAGGSPAWPRFKYNDFGLLRFGQRLRIDMRYWPDPPAGDRTTAAAGQTWVPMVAGPITDMQFAFGAGDAPGAQLVVLGEDDLGLLRDTTERRWEMDRLAEKTIVERVLAHAKFPLQQVADPAVARPSFAEDDGQGLQEALQAGQTYLAFVQKLAERLDFEVFLEFADLASPGSPLELHFEPRRSRRPPTAQPDLFTLRRGQTLLDFKPTLRVAGQYTKVEVRGRHRDPLLAREVRGKGTDAILADELHVGAGDGPLSSGPAVRERFFAGRPANNFTLQNQPNLDEVRADWYAQSIIRRKARELLSIDATTVGLPRLRPGNHVEIRGMRPPFDGFYYVTHTTHTIGEDGFRTQLQASRPGMELPGAQGRFVEAP